MNRIKLTKNLFLDEYVPEQLYRKFEQKPHILIGLLSQELVNADQKLRDKFGAVTINNWWFGGKRIWSGIRTPDSPDYSLTSQHSFGNASDKIFKDVTPEEVREYIENNWQSLGITCIEKNVSWVHSDIRWWPYNELLIV